METLTLVQFAKRYGMSHQRASKWLDAGTAPGMRTPGTNRFYIPVAWCDAFDRGEAGRWTPNPIAPEPEPLPIHPYLRRVG